MIVQIFTIIDATCSCEPYIVKYKSLNGYREDFGLIG